MHLHVIFIINVIEQITTTGNTDGEIQNRFRAKSKVINVQ